MISNVMLLFQCVTLVMLGLVLFSLIKKWRQGTGFYDIFSISDGKLTIQAAVPISYPLEDIERVEFSSFATTKSGFTNFAGQLRIIKKNGKSSRSYLFDSSVLCQKMVGKSSKEEIEESIQLLMEKLERHGIPTRMVGMK